MFLSFMSVAAATCTPINVTEKYVEMAARHAPAALVKREARTTDGQIYAGLLAPVVAKDSFSSYAEPYYKFMAHNPGLVNVTAGALAGAAPQALADFKRRFPKTSCNFRFYIAPTYGAINGAAYYANGSTRLVLAPDTIAKDGPYSFQSLKVLIDHELFHVYQSQVSEGAFGPQVGDNRPLYNSIWSEGLATFVAGRLNEQAPLDVVLASNTLATAVETRIGDIARDLLPRLSSRSNADYARYCQGATDDPLVPARAGYYIGYRFAQELSHRMTLDEMAHMPQARVEAELKRFLQKLANYQ